MHREESQMASSCIVCGAEVSEGQGREFSFGTRGVLCWACAVARGGAYDDAQNRWTRPPNLAGLDVEGYERA
jgi:hypothetical protein